MCNVQVTLQATWNKRNENTTLRSDCDDDAYEYYGWRQVRDEVKTANSKNSRIKLNTPLCNR